MADRGGRTQRFRALIAGAMLVLVVSGCAGAPPSVSSSPSIGPSSSATPTPTLEPNPTPIVDQSASFRFLPDVPPQGQAPDITCDGAIGANDPVAIVQLLASTPNQGPIVLRDYADVANPRTVCTFPTGVAAYQILDARHLLLGYGEGYGVVDVPEVRVHHWFKLPVTPGFQNVVAVSPALDQVTWMSEDPPPGTGTDKIHITTSTADNVVATVVDHNLGRCGQPDDSSLGAYTRSGAHVFVLGQPIQTESSLTVVEGLTPVFSVIPPAGDWPQGGHPAMALWSPTSEILYYRQGTDVWKWTAESGAVRFLTNTVWYYPTISPDGRHLAFSLQRPDGFHDAYIVDLAQEGAPKLIGAGLRNQPVFLNNTQLWYRAEGIGEPCGPSGIGPRVYNIVTGVESNSVIESVWKVWPATSSNW